VTTLLSHVVRRKEGSMGALDKIDPPIVEPDNVEPQPPEGRGDHPTVTADTARGGPPGTRVLVVLAVGAIGAFVLLAIIYAFYFSGTP
jgi:hypothetical protein